MPLCYVLIYLWPLVWVFRWMSFLNGSSHVATRLLTYSGTQTPAQLDFTTLLSTLTPPDVMARCCLAMFNYDVTADLANIDTPVLVVAADGDVLTNPDASDFMNGHLPNAGLVTVSPGNHQALIERHTEVNSAAQRFINTLKQQPQQA